MWKSRSAASTSAASTSTSYSANAQASTSKAGFATSKHITLSIDNGEEDVAAIYDTAGGTVLGNDIDARPAPPRRASSSFTSSSIWRRKEKLPVTPGSTLSGHILVHSAKELRDAKLLKVVLTGKCGATVLGRGRWQAGIVASGISSTGPGSAVPIQYREVHTFLRSEKLLWNPDDTPLGSANKEGDQLRFDFNIDIPRLKQCTCPAKSYVLPPTSDLRNGEDGRVLDRSTIEVFYSASAILERSGILRRNAKVKVSLNMADDAAPGYTAQEEIVAMGRGPLKYASDTQESPELQCQLSFTAPTVANATIPYTVTYRMAPDSALLANLSYDRPPVDEGDTSLPPTYESAPGVANPLLASINPRVEVGLTRRCVTRPVEKPLDGIQSGFPSYLLVIGTNNPLIDGTSSYDPQRGIGEIKGELVVPKGEVSVFTCGADIQHSVSAKMVSDILRGPIIATGKVYLPSGR